MGFGLGFPNFRYGAREPDRMGRRGAAGAVDDPPADLPAAAADGWLSRLAAGCAAASGAGARRPPARGGESAPSFAPAARAASAVAAACGVKAVCILCFGASLVMVSANATASAAPATPANTNFVFTRVAPMGKLGMGIGTSASGTSAAIQAPRSPRHAVSSSRRTRSSPRAIRVRTVATRDLAAPRDLARGEAVEETQHQRRAVGLLDPREGGHDFLVGFEARGHIGRRGHRLLARRPPLPLLAPRRAAPRARCQVSRHRREPAAHRAPGSGRRSSAAIIVFLREVGRVVGFRHQVAREPRHPRRLGEERLGIAMGHRGHGVAEDFPPSRNLDSRGGRAPARLHAAPGATSPLTTRTESSTTRPMKLREIATRLGGEVVGDPDAEIARPGKIEDAKAGEITFLSNPKYETFLAGTKATAVIVSRGLDHHKYKAPGRSFVVVADAYVGFMMCLKAFESGVRPFPRGST